MANLSIPERIRTFNADRDPKLLVGKYAAMRENRFRFFRGTSHLFNNDIPANSFVWKAPQTWNVGDLHIENFGSFKADNHVPYFDLNDFDECILAPNLADLARLTCSLFVAADFLKLNADQVGYLAKTLTDTYAHTLSLGYIRSLERATSRGIIRQLLLSVKFRKREAFLKSRISYKKHKAQFRRKNAHIFEADPESKTRVTNAFRAWSETQPDPGFFNVLDVAHRIAGTGSLGVERYAILIGRSNKPGKQHLLDLKKALPSTLQARFDKNQPVWRNEAERIVEVRKRIQAASPALLHPLVFPDGTSYVLRELQPSEDKIALIELAGKPKKLENLVATMGRLCGWGHLRSSGRQGSAIADELIEFGKNYDTWQQLLLDYACQYSKQVRIDYEAYCLAYDNGFFE